METPARAPMMTSRNRRWQAGAGTSGTAVATTGGQPKKKRKHVLSSGDFLQVGPITYGKGKEMINERDAEAEKKQEEKRQKALERKEDEAAKLRERKELAREGAQQLWKARGNYKVLSKKQMYAFLAEIGAWVVTDATTGTTRPVKATDALKEVLWSSYEKSLENAGGSWEQLVYVCYSPPADEMDGDRRALPLPEATVPIGALPAPKGPVNDPQSLKGKAVRKKFGRRWFNGTVQSYSRANGYRITYEDGDVEELWADDVIPLLV